MTEEELIEKIGAWLDDELPEEDAAIFQDLSESDDDFRSLVHLVIAQRAALRKMQDQYYLEKAMHTKCEPQRQRRSFRILKISFTSSLILVTSIIIYDFSQKKPKSQFPSETLKPLLTKILGGFGNSENYLRKPSNTIDIPKRDHYYVFPNAQPYPPPKSESHIMVMRFKSDSDVDLDQNFSISKISKTNINQNWIKINENLYIVNAPTPISLPDPDLEASPTMGNGADDNHSRRTYLWALRMKEQQPKQAVDSLTTIKETDGDYYNAQKVLAVLYMRQGKHHEAALCYEKYCEYMSNGNTKWALIGFYLRDHQNRESKAEAIKLLRDFEEREGSKYQQMAKKTLKLIQ